MLAKESSNHHESEPLVNKHCNSASTSSSPTSSSSSSAPILQKRNELFSKSSLPTFPQLVIREESKRKSTDSSIDPGSEFGVDLSTNMNYHHPPHLHPFVHSVNYHSGTGASHKSHAAQVVYMPSSSMNADETLKQKHFNNETGTRISGRRFCCGCFASRRSCCGCFCIIFLLLIVGLGVAVFFIFPRMPTVKVGEPYFTSSSDPSSAFAISGSPLTASASSPFTLTFNLQSDVSVYSPNYIDFALNFVSLSGNLENSSKQNYFSNVPVTGQANNVDIKSFATTNFTLPLQVKYTTTTPLSLSSPDPALASLLSSCSFMQSGSSNSNNNIILGYQVKISAKLLAWTGFVPSFNSSSSFPCPSSLTSLNQLIPT